MTVNTHTLIHTHVRTHAHTHMYVCMYVCYVQIQLLNTSIDTLSYTHLPYGMLMTEVDGRYNLGKEPLSLE